MFDDAAPLLDDDQADKVNDMIGTAVIDLSKIKEEGGQIHERFLVWDLEGLEVGSIEVWLTTQDIAADGRVSGQADHSRNIVYNREFEDAFIDKVCREVVKNSENTEIGFLFSLFCHGSWAIHKDDFITTIKGFRVPVYESEIELFVENCEAFGGDYSISRDSFTRYF